ncbi:hypothetical protein NL676_010033 [Syzygium grande]|nr:hypothetical protein NL676_010033 [Syzygium grande]
MGGRCGLKSDNGSSVVKCAHYQVPAAFALESTDLVIRATNGNDGTNLSHSGEAGNTQHAVGGARGIHLATLELYLKAQIDDPVQVPRPNDNIWAICLSGYQPKETLRTIPECAHYFPAHCID